MSKHVEHGSSQRTGVPAVAIVATIAALVAIALPVHGEDRILADDMDGYVVVDENGRTKARIHRYLWTDDYVIRDRGGRTKSYIRDDRLYKTDDIRPD